MRTLTGLRASAGLLVPLLLLASPALADAPDTVGGERLAARGVVAPVGAPRLPATVAAGWLVADLDTGQVLASKNPHGRFGPASTLKTLTAETLIPRLDPHQLVTPTFDDLNVDGSKVGLVQKLRYPVSELFTAMLVVSGNDAANTLATANGGIPKTVAEMNAEAKRLHALDTHAVNANGLDATGQVSSAYDLALIARAAMQNPSFRAYVATKHSKVRGPRGPIPISSHDKLLYNYPGAIGIKNGYTVRARATFVGAASRGGHTLVVTLMRTNPHYWPEAAALLDWGFKATAAGVQPVGQLVDPDPDPSQVVPDQQQAQAPVQAVAARKPIAGGDVPVLPLGIIGAGVAVMGAGVSRSRRRRRRRYRLRLPV
ncbi:MAG: serine hydrolase [Mycobacteriales bacterium]